MPKQYNLDQIKNLTGRIKFNYDDGSDIEPSYHIIRLEFFGKAVNGGAKKTSIIAFNVNTPRSTPFTPKEIYTKVRNVMGNAVANKIKELYIDLIDEDISQ